MKNILSLTNTRYPIRKIAASVVLVLGFIYLVIQGLPAFGVSITPEQLDVLNQWFAGLGSLVTAIVTVFLGEQYVTPVSDPRDHNGNRLAPRIQ